MLPDFLAVIATGLLYLENLGIHQRAIPPYLQEGPDEPFLPFAPCSLQNVSVAEIRERAQKQRLTGIFVLLQALFVGLRIKLFVAVGFGRACEVEFNIQKVNGFANRIIHVFMAEPGEVVKIVVAEIVVELHRAPLRELDMLVHQALLAAPFAVSEESEKLHRIYAALHPLIHKDMPPV